MFRDGLGHRGKRRFRPGPGEPRQTTAGRPIPKADRRAISPCNNSSPPRNMTPHKDEPVFFDLCEAVFFDLFKNHPHGWTSETIEEALKRNEYRHFLHDVGRRDLGTGRSGGPAPDAAPDAEAGAEGGFDSSDRSRCKST